MGLSSSYAIVGCLAHALLSTVDLYRWSREMAIGPGREAMVGRAETAVVVMDRPAGMTRGKATARAAINARDARNAIVADVSLAG